MRSLAYIAILGALIALAELDLKLDASPVDQKHASRVTRGEDDVRTADVAQLKEESLGELPTVTESKPIRTMLDKVDLAPGSLGLAEDSTLIRVSNGTERLQKEANTTTTVTSGASPFSYSSTSGSIGFLSLSITLISLVLA